MEDADGAGVRLLDPNSVPSERAGGCQSMGRLRYLLLTVGNGCHDLLELYRVYTLPDCTRRSGGAGVLSSLVLVYGAVDRKVQGEYVIIHGELEVPIRSLVLQSGRIRDFGLRRTWMCARRNFLEWVWCCNPRAIRGLRFDFRTVYGLLVIV